MPRRRWQREPIREVDTESLDRAIGTPGWQALVRRLRDQIAARDAAETAAEQDDQNEAA